jgi:hypothetical protein
MQNDGMENGLTSNVALLKQQRRIGASVFAVSGNCMSLHEFA